MTWVIHEPFGTAYNLAHARILYFMTTDGGFVVHADFYGNPQTEPDDDPIVHSCDTEAEARDFIVTMTARMNHAAKNGNGATR